MSWIIEMFPYKGSQLEQLYQKAELRTNKQVANVLKVHSISPETLEIHMRLYEHLMFEKSELSRFEREMIGVIVSKANECEYCVSHHATSLFHVTQNKPLMEKIANNYEEANLNSKHLAICKYVEKCTKYPYRMQESDIKMLKNEGLNDLAIFQVNQICAYFNYVNRIVFGLGVELEQY
jgi:uncharacterized peroxidase-related enzyme